MLVPAAFAQQTTTTLPPQLGKVRTLVGEDAAKADSVPAKIEKKPPKVWGQLEKEQSKQVTEKLKQFGEKIKKHLSINLTLYETDYFLFYSDLDESEARRWSGVLNKMYARMLRMFNIPNGTNVWHGKAMIFVFKDKKNFVNYERKVEGNKQNLTTTAGICHTMGPLVRIAFYRQPVDLTFAAVLVHETSHGFLHRYRSPRRVAQWVNEGLAEWIAYNDQVVNNGSKSAMKRNREAVAYAALSQTGSLGGMLSQWRGGWQYGVAVKYTEFLIKYKPKQWLAYLNAMKDGEDHGKAFEKAFGMSAEKMTDVFGKWMKINRPIKP